jgi:hypothetical protein
VTLKNKGGNSTGHDMLKRIDAGLVDEKDKCWWRDDRGNIDLFIWKRANGSFATVQFCRGDSVVEIRSGETQAYGTVDNAEGGFRRIQSPTFHFADQTSPEMQTQLLDKLKSEIDASEDPILQKLLPLIDRICR